MSDKMRGFTFQISQDLKLLQRWFSPQNEPNDSKFKIRQTTTIMTFYLWRNSIKIVMIFFLVF